MRFLPFILVGWITFSVAIYFNLLEFKRSKTCDTTYIYEGYSDVSLSPSITSQFPRYKLIQYLDQSPSLQSDIAALKANRPVIPLLFIHGHLGSPQQMRSMASESSREIIRRYNRYKATNGATIRWIQWYATDFGAEPSAFVPRIVHAQSQFVTHCIKHLIDVHKSDRIITVGYSMGGIVLEKALQNQSRMAVHIPIVLTLGAPRHHLPSFLPPFEPSNSFMTNNKEECNDVDRKYSSVTKQTYRVHILAGPGDFMIPGLSSWSKKDRKLHSSPSSSLLEVDMDDVPGVWCTSGHKGMVSCNQLVRVTVPFLIDNALRNDSKSIMTDAVSRLTTDINSGIILSDDIDTMARRDEDQKSAEDDIFNLCSTIQIASDSIVRTNEGEEKDVDVYQVTENTTQYNVHCFEWKATIREHQHGNNDSTTRSVLSLFLTGPLYRFRVVGQRRYGSNTTTTIVRSTPDLARFARTIPGMLSDYPTATQSSNSKRPWYEIVAGVNWKANATHFLQLPLGTVRQLESPSTGDVHGFDSIIVAVMPPEKSKEEEREEIEKEAVLNRHNQQPPHAPPTILAQRTTSTKDTKRQNVSIKNIIVTSSQIEQKSMSLLKNALFTFFIAQGPVARLHALPSPSCDVVRDNHYHSPVIVTTTTMSMGRENTVTIGDGVRKGVDQGLPLWHPITVGRDIILLSDPRCDIQLKYIWDIGPWIGYVVRYHTYALPSLMASFSVFRVSTPPQTSSAIHLNRGLTTAVLKMGYVGSLLLLPPLASLRIFSLPPPWLPLSVLDVFLLSCVALSALFVVETFVKYLIKLRVTARGIVESSAFNIVTVVIVVTVVFVGLMSVWHPAAPVLVGFIILSLFGPSHPSSQLWTVFHLISCIPAILWTFGYFASSGLFSFHGIYNAESAMWWERGLMLILGWHSSTSCTLSDHSNNDSITIHHSAFLFAIKLCIGCGIALSGLWGVSYGMLYGTVAFCIADWIQRSYVLFTRAISLDDAKDDDVQRNNDKNTTPLSLSSPVEKLQHKGDKKQQ